MTVLLTLLVLAVAGGFAAGYFYCAWVTTQWFKANGMVMFDNELRRASDGEVILR